MTAVTELRVGTRASTLARAQAQAVAARLKAATGLPVRMVPVTTEGDINRRPLTDFAGRGVFVTALRDALLSGEVNIAVHSLKDLPTTPEPGVTLAAVPAREDPRDAVVARGGLTLAELPVGANVGTGSPRRAAQLHALGLGVTVRAVRGNVDTRIAKVASGELDAVVLARAGLARLGRLDEATQILDPLQMLPAPGQGALACECRDDATEVATLLRETLEDATTRTVVTAERSLLNALEAGCTAPVGALGDVALGEDGDELWLRALVAHPCGAPLLRMSATGPPHDAVGLGRRLAGELLADGAGELCKEELVT